MAGTGQAIPYDARAAAGRQPPLRPATIGRRIMIAHGIPQKAIERVHEEGARGQTVAFTVGSKTRNGPVQQETKQRVARWRAMAATMANKNPHLSPLQIARRIQQSSTGKRKGGVLTYSITVILKYIRNT